MFLVKLSQEMKQKLVSNVPVIFWEKFVNVEKSKSLKAIPIMVSVVLM